MRKQIDWRLSYEPFMGKSWEFGLYKIREKYVGGEPMYDVYHGARLERAFSYWEQANQWASERMALIRKALNKSYLSQIGLDRILTSCILLT